MECRPYAAYAVYDAKRWWWLLTVPVLRNIFATLTQSKSPVPLWEVAVATCVIAYAVIKWRRCRYELSHSNHKQFHTVRIRQGVLTRRALRICADDAASVEVECTPLLWILGGRRIRINTEGLRRRSDAILYLSATRTRRLFAPLSHKNAAASSRLWPIVVMALSGSNAAVGLLTAAPLLHQAGKVLGQEFPKEVLSAAMKGIPALLQTGAIVLSLGWVFATVRTFLRYINFHAWRDRDLIQLSFGLFTRRRILIHHDKITALELRQTVVMRLLGVYTAVITAAGYGRDAGSRPVLIPAARPCELCHYLDRLLPAIPAGAPLITPRRPWRYLMWPLVWLCGGIVLLFFPVWPPAVIVVIGVALWWLFLRLLGAKEAGVGITADTVTICYPRGLALYRVHLPAHVTDCITITRTPFQRWRGLCTVEIRCYGEKRRRHRVWGLPYAAAKELLKFPLQ